MSHMLPLFLDVRGRRVLLVGGGAVAAAKLRQLLAARAHVHAVSPDFVEEIEQSGVSCDRRRFEPADLDGAWLVVAAATPDVNQQVAAAAEVRHIFVNAVDDPAHATAFMGGVVRRDGLTVALSTDGTAPALARLLREAIDALLPHDLDHWLEASRRQRAFWREDRVPMGERRPLLLEALNRLYHRGNNLVPAIRAPKGPRHNSESVVANDAVVGQGFSPAKEATAAQGFSPAKDRSK